MTDKDISVAFLGPEGTFSEAAARRHFGDAVSMQATPGIDDVFLAVEAGQTSHGVVPVENSTEGAVTITQECLIDTSLRISAEIYVPIVHHLMVAASSPVITDRSTLKRIVSHRQSLAQCRLWLRSQFPGVPQHTVSSNAEAARIAASEPETAAIAGQQAADRYALHVLHSEIQDRSNNTTRFLVLSREAAAPAQRNKTSILVYTENRPGSLLRVLMPFDRHQVSLTKIETRPARDGIWAYVFFIDFEGHVQDAAVQAVFAELASCTVEIRLLGSYPMAESTGEA